MHVSGGNYRSKYQSRIIGDVVCVNYQHKVLGGFGGNGERRVCGRMTGAVRIIAPHIYTFSWIYWFNWTLIDDVRNRIIKRHFVCCFPLFCSSESCLVLASCQLVVSWIDSTEINTTTTEWIVRVRKMCDRVFRPGRNWVLCWLNIEQLRFCSMFNMNLHDEHS